MCEMKITIKVQFWLTLTISESDWLVLLHPDVL